MTRHPSTRLRALSRSSSRHALSCGLGLALVAVFAGTAQAQTALPTGGSIASGSATIATGGSAVTVTQTTNKAIINWTGFDVGAGNSVTFVQPDASSATLNRVTGGTTSTIAGKISSNGAVYLVNPNGIVITSTGKIRAGSGFIASTLGIADSDFNAGNLKFKGSGASASVSNAGTITANQGGYVALLGGTVSNSGTISVPLGKVGLGSGERIVLDVNGDGFLQVAVPTSAITGGNAALIEMTGTIAASGGRVQLSAATVKDAVRNVINVPGSISADSAVGDGGTILLLGGDGGTVSATGTLTARATGTTGNGGLIETSGKTVAFTGLTTDASAAYGTAGTWLIDPVNLTVDAAAAATISANLATANVTLQTTSTTATGPGTQAPGNGDITINSAVGWTSANTLSLVAYNNIAINAAIAGTNGGLTLSTGNAVANTGSISAAAAVTVGRFTLTNGAWSQVSATLPAFSATDFRFTPANATFLRATGGTGAVATPYRITDVYGLQGIGSSTLLSSNFVLTNDIDAAGTAAWNAGAGFIPIGTTGASGVLNAGTGFTGTLNGANFSISGLTINRPTRSYVGLFGYVNSSGAAISNIGLDGGTISGGYRVGALVGYLVRGNISNASSTSAVSASNGTVGGLVGEHRAGTIRNAYATGSVSAGPGGYAGGLVGYDFAALVDSYATGAVTSGGLYTGGLVGVQGGGALGFVYATGSVTSTADATGGLVGYSTVAISNAYATGAVSGTSHVGGLAGGSDSPNFTNSYWDSYSTGQAQALGAGAFSGATAVTSDPAQASATNYAYKASAYANLTAASGIGTATPSGFVFMPGDTTRPFLAFEVPTSALLATNANGALVLTNSHQLQLIGYDATRLAGSYSLGQDLDLAETGAPVAGTPGSYAGMWSTAGFVPIGNAATAFTGSFDGARHVIAGLVIKRPSTDYVGLFGNESGTISNIGLIGGTISGASLTGSLVGLQRGGTISYAYATGSVTGTQAVGGLVGDLQGTISYAYATGNVSGAGNVGGLVGAQGGAINNAYATGTVTASGHFVGGLVGYLLDGSISNAYATGATSGTADVGGLVGFQNQGSIYYAYATGAVTGPNNSSGGLVGYHGDGNIINSYWDSYSTGRATAAGHVGPGDLTNVKAVTSDSSQSAAANYAYKASAYANLAGASGVGTANPSGFAVMPGDSTRPFLAFEVPTSFTVATNAAGQLVLTNSHQLQLVGYNAATLSGSYILGNDIDLGYNSGITGNQPGTFAGMWSTAGFVPIGTDGAGNAWNGTGYSAIADITSGIYGFSGSLDGNGYAITRLHINRRTAKNVGLFGVSSGTLSNLSVSGSVTGLNGVGGLVGLLHGGSVTGSSSSVDVRGNNLIGGLVGNAFDGSRITLSNASGRVVGVSDVGGLVGYASGATISRSFATGRVTADNYAGGLIGYQYNSATDNSYATGPVSANLNTAGGLVGYLYGGSVVNSYAAAAITAPRNRGGLIGQNLGGTVSSSYWDTNVSGALVSAGGTGETTAAMHLQTTYAGWDFATIWNAPTPTTYPTLRQ